MDLDAGHGPGMSHSCAKAFEVGVQLILCNNSAHQIQEAACMLSCRLGLNDCIFHQTGICCQLWIWLCMPLHAANCAASAAEVQTADQIGRLPI